MIGAISIPISIAISIGGQVRSTKLLDAEVTARPAPVAA
jgi:hypothetical protein